MTVLHLGVVDLPHPGGEKSGLTTGDLAEILEGKYGLYSSFVEDEAEMIAGAVTESLGDAVDNILAGLTPSANPFAAAEQEVRQQFINFLDTRQIESLGIPGVPTQAALDGVNHRRGKVGHGPRRPSFIDTGTLRIATAAWVDPD